MEFRRIPYTISPESSKPMVSYLPQADNRLIPGRIVTVEEFGFEEPGSVTVASYRDAVHTVRDSLTGEPVSRAVELAPVLDVDEIARAVLDEARLISIYRRAVREFSWSMDETGFRLEAMPQGSRDERTHVLDVRVRGGAGSSMVVVQPVIGEERFLDPDKVLPSVRHKHLRKGKVVFEWLSHVENGQESLKFPVYAGYRYDREALVYPCLKDAVLAPRYNPLSLRTLVSPYIAVTALNSTYPFTF